MTHEGQYIDIGTDTKSGVLAFTVQHFQKISLDTWDIKNPNKVYKSYNIPKNEEIIAYCKSGFLGFSINGMIFTDKAFYPELSQKELGRIAYIDLCKYVISRNDSNNGNYNKNHAGIYLCSNEKKYQIHTGTLITKNTVADEIYKALIAVQNELIEQNHKAKYTMNNVVDNIFNSFKNKMKCGLSNSEDNEILYSLIKMQPYKDAATLLLAESKYRIFNFDFYNDFINNLSINNLNINSDLLEKLKNPTELFSKQLISELSDTSLNISKEYLERISKNLTRLMQTRHRSEENIIFALILTRLYRFHTAQRLLAETASQCGYEFIIPAECFRLIQGNKIMHQVYEMIINGEEIPADFIEATDGLGLTPLHYKLILNNNDNIDKLLNSRDWSADNQLPFDKDIINIFDYSVVAAIKNNPNLSKIIQETDSNIKYLTTQHKAAVNQNKNELNSIKNIEKKIIETDRKLRNCRNNGDYESENYLKNMLDELKSEKEEAAYQYIQNLEETRKLRDELNEKTKEKINVVKKIAQLLLESNSPLIKLLLQIYNNDSSYNLKNILSHSDEKQFKLYNYQDYSFLIQNDIELNIPYKLMYISDYGAIILEAYLEINSLEIKRPYDNSWFSVQAHCDLQTLTSEYRTLAKTYHPDICDKNNANEIFANISQEYEYISEKLK